MSQVSHIGLGRSGRETSITLDGDYRTVTIAKELTELLTAYLAPDQGFAARRAMETIRWEGDYDHLARFGEWDETDLPVTERLP